MLKTRAREEDRGSRHNTYASRVLTGRAELNTILGSVDVISGLPFCMLRAKKIELIRKMRLDTARIAGDIKNISKKTRVLLDQLNI